MSLQSRAEIDVLIIGGGIAGSAAAYYAHLAGRAPTIVDFAEDCASTVPTALINPMRGYLGKVMPEGAVGARFTFALIDSLIDEGHSIAHGRGLTRPMPDPETRALWQTQLPADLPHTWIAPIDPSLGLTDIWKGALILPESGWVETAPLLAALKSASSVPVIHGRVDHIEGRAVLLSDGTWLSANTILQCTGALGARLSKRKATYRPGGLIVTSARLSPGAVSYGVYSAPSGTGSVAGSTREKIWKSYPEIVACEDDFAVLRTRLAKLFVRPLGEHRHWRGVRLESALALPGQEFLEGFGSAGYLFAPLRAYRWAQRTL